MDSIVVSVRVGNRTVVEQEWKPEMSRLDEEASALGRGVARAAYQAVVEGEDERLAREVPPEWRNRGKRKRWLLTAVGYLGLARRVYVDEAGRRHRPLDKALGLEPHQRATAVVQQLGAYLASYESYRVSATVLGRIVGESISAVRIQHMVWGLGKALDEEEAREREAVFGRGEALEGGRQIAPMLYGESDGIYLSLQREVERRAEVRVGIVYSGKELVGQNRWRLQSKVAVTALVADSEEWQEMMLKAAYQAFDLDRCGCLIAGGDGGLWVKHTFDRLGLPGVYQLDRYHMYRWVRRMPRGSQREVVEWVKTAMANGYEAVEGRLHDLVQRHTGDSRAKLEQFRRYLSSNREGVMDYGRQLGLVEEGRKGLGAIEGNVDKLVGQRMKGRGRSWRREGLCGMLALIRHRRELSAHTVRIPTFSFFKERSSVLPRRRHIRDADYLYHGVPIIHSHWENDPEVQWLKRRINGEPILSFPTPLPPKS